MNAVQKVVTDILADIQSKIDQCKDIICILPHENDVVFDDEYTWREEFPLPYSDEGVFGMFDFWNDVRKILIPKIREIAKGYDIKELTETHCSMGGVRYEVFIGVKLT